MTDITVSRQTRLAIVAALQGLTLNGVAVKVLSPGVWEPQIEELVQQAQLAVRAGSNEVKTPSTRGPMTFTTDTSILVIGRLAAVTEEQAQDDLEALRQLVEQAVLCNQGLIQYMQKASVQTEQEITAEGEYHSARFAMTFTPEYFEVFENVSTVDLAGISIHIDTAAPFDATGTYANPAFPESVVPAPRITGPDGREEALINVDFQ